MGREKKVAVAETGGNEWKRKAILPGQAELN